MKKKDSSKFLVHFRISAIPEESRDNCFFLFKPGIHLHSRVLFHKKNVKCSGQTLFFPDNSNLYCYLGFPAGTSGKEPAC